MISELVLTEVLWWCKWVLVLLVLVSKASSDRIRAGVSVCSPAGLQLPRGTESLNHSWSYREISGWRLLKLNCNIWVKCCHLNMACLIVRVRMVKSVTVSVICWRFGSRRPIRSPASSRNRCSCQKCRDIPCCGPLRCSGRNEACGCHVDACLRKLTLPDVVIRCFIFCIPFREPGFFGETGVFSHAKDTTTVLLMIVNAVMHLNVSDIVDLVHY